MEIQNKHKEYHSDGTMVYSCQYRIIFCPKYRRKVLTDGVDTRFKELVLEKQTEYQYTVVEMEVMPDHSTPIVGCQPQGGRVRCGQPYQGLHEPRASEGVPVIETRLPTLWTRSKFISSVGAVTLEVVKKYIEEQHDV